MKKPLQYTIRNVDATLDQALRARCVREGTSLNDAVLHTLGEAMAPAGARTFDDLDDLAGTWVEDPACDAVLRSFDQVDEAFWKRA